MLVCKFCKKPGKFDRFSRKILCEEHGENQRQFTAIWTAISELQINSGELSSPRSLNTREDMRTPIEEKQLLLLRFLEERWNINYPRNLKGQGETPCITPRQRKLQPGRSHLRSSQ